MSSVMLVGIRIICAICVWIICAIGPSPAAGITNAEGLRCGVI